MPPRLSQRPQPQPSILRQNRKQQMILPHPVNTQITPPLALNPKTTAQQQPRARTIIRHATRLDAIQPQLPKPILQDQRQSLPHITPPDIINTRPITHARRHVRSITNVAERNPPHQPPRIIHPVLVPKNQKSAQNFRLPPTLMIIQKHRKTPRCQNILAPQRLPRLKKIPAPPPQRNPLPLNPARNPSQSHKRTSQRNRNTKKTLNEPDQKTKSPIIQPETKVPIP